jgi:nitronate monooxygenase
VAAQCKAGIVGCFPHVNARPSSQLDEWLAGLRRELDDYQSANPEAIVAPFGVNLVVHHSVPRHVEDLALVVKHRVPIVLTSLGHPGVVVDQVHAYGGLVFCDVTSARHARKAAEAGVDGLVCVGAGAGGHASNQSAFSLVREIREFWQGCLVMGGGIGDGYQIRSAEVLGADLAYIGTRFLASEESNASAPYKQMVIEAGFDELVNTDRLTGISCNYLKPSLDACGIEVDKLPPKRADVSAINDSSAKLWKDIWTAGHGVGTIHDTPTVATLVERMRVEYRRACALPPSPAIAGGI